MARSDERSRLENGFPEKKLATGQRGKGEGKEKVGGRWKKEFRGQRSGVGGQGSVLTTIRLKKARRVVRY